MTINKFTKHLKKTRLRLSLPFLSYELALDDILNSKDVDERIKRLSTIKNDLADTVIAVEQLQADALKSKHEADNLKKVVKHLEQDKSTAEEILKVPEESFARLVSKASSKGRFKGIIEGAFIGFVTGVLSSGLVWYITKPKAIEIPATTSQLVQSTVVKAPEKEIIATEEQSAASSAVQRSEGEKPEVKTNCSRTTDY